MIRSMWLCIFEYLYIVFGFYYFCIIVESRFEINIVIESKLKEKFLDMVDLVKKLVNMKR